MDHIAGHSTQVKILLIRDNPQDNLLILEMLDEAAGNKVLDDIQPGCVHATSFSVEQIRLEAGLARVGNGGLDAILLDLTQPDSQALTTISHICSLAPGVPILVLSDLDDEMFGVDALQHGAQDYLIKKQLDAHQLKRSIRFAIERKQAQKELQAQRDFATQVMSMLGQGLTLTDAHRRFEYVNMAYASLIGYPPEKLLGRRLDDFTTVEDHSLLVQAHEKRIAGETTTHEKHLKRADGSVVHTLTTSVPRWHDGKFAGAISVVTDLSGQMQAQEALRESEARYRQMFQRNLAIQWLVDPETGTIIEANQAALDFYGYTLEELKCMKITDINISVDEAGFKKVAVQAWEAPTYFVFQHKLSSGEIRDVEVFTGPLSAGGRRLLYSIIHDITERKQAEDALRKEQELLKTLLANIAGVIVACDADGVLKLFDRTRREFLTERIPPDEWAKHYGLYYADSQQMMRKEDVPLYRAFNGETLHNVEMVLAPEGRAPRTYLASGQPLFGPNGEKAGAVVAMHDITERKQAEEALSANEEKYRELVENTSEWVWATDRDGRITYSNPAVEAALGYSAQELIGTYRLALMHKEDRCEFEGLIAQLEAGKQGLVGLTRRWRHKDGSQRYLESSAIPIIDEQGNLAGYRGIDHDVTERRRAEDTRLAREAAEGANHAKSEFLSRMSHELRTPLNSVLGFAELLKIDDLTDEQHAHLDYIVKGGTHLLNLINEVLDISRIEAGHLSLSPEPVEVGFLLSECVDLVGPLYAQRNLQLDTSALDKWELEGLNKYILADHQRLKQVMLNILANAVKYNHEGGSVSLSWEERKGHKEGTGDRHRNYGGEDVAGTESRDENDVEVDLMRISVTDTGPGISTEGMAKLFSPFERLGAETRGIEGTGLGLALSKHLVEAMGGSIGASSIQGQGSTFWVEFPIVEGPLERNERLNSGHWSLPQLPAQADQIEQIHTVLYIEDNLANLRLVEHMLHHLPQVKLISAMQGGLGLELAYQHSPSLILLDLHLPDINGDEVLLQLRSNPRTSAIPVVMISADATVRQIDRLLAAGAFAYLTKPLDVKQFLQLVETTLNQTAQRV